MSKALLVVDVQQDFWTGGALAVQAAETIFAPLVRTLTWAREQGVPVIATRDWHPPDHASFRPQGGDWPVHCVAGTAGAAFVAGLDWPPDLVVISKGTERTGDGYSPFENPALGEHLKALECRQLFVAGLATDYCVRAAVLDALAAGFAVTVLEDAVRSVDRSPGDGERACAEMRAAGACFDSSEAVTK